MNDARRARLIAASRDLEQPLRPEDCDRLLAYLALLERWNKVYNLTSVRDPDQMLTLHLIDCLAALPSIKRHLDSHPVTRILDAGSGGGLPGVVLATLFTDCSITCVDTVGKKVAFIRQVAAELNLTNLMAEHTRVEKLDAPPFDIVTSRAFASLSDFVQATRHLIAADGVWLAMKGKHPDLEVRQLPADIRVFHVEPLHVPGLEAERCLVWMRIQP